LRKTIIATLVAVLALAAGASAATGGADTGNVSFSSKKAGTKKKPHPVGYTLKIDTNAPAGTLPQVTREVKVRIYGLKVDGKHFKTCSLNKILTAKNDNVCPKKALVASGAIEATLQGTGGTALPCTPNLNVWNGGQGKLSYFFRTEGSHQCGGLQTGSTPPYPGTYKMQGKYFTSDVKIPDAINYPVASLTGLLSHEHLFFRSQTTKVKGKKYISQASVACKKGKRPWSVTVLTAPFGSTTSTPSQTSTTSDSASCSK
jgi:hypothetical protein